jgi:4-alpha-glucanotransferase
LAERRRPRARRGADPAAWGVAPGFEDVDHQWRDAPPATVEAILAALGATARAPGPSPVLTIRLDRPLATIPTGQLTLEDGTTLPVQGVLPPGLPPGYHQLAPETGASMCLIASPGRCRLPAAPEWGFAAQLYAARSRRSWGFGDLSDLRRLGRYSDGLGARFVLVNPLHATSPTLPQQPSPYFPGSRCFLNPLYLAVEDVPGASQAAALDRLAAAGRALNHDRLIDRDRVWTLKSEALEALYRSFQGDERFEAYRTERGEVLTRFATFCALAEHHGASWPSWPAPLRDPRSAAVRAFAASPAGKPRLRYHAWLQWLLDQQLEAAARALPVVSDLAIGVDAGGADAWMWPDVFVIGMRVGAPPDQFNTRGQDWALPPFDPWRLRDACYEPWIQSIRGALRHGGGLRLDHVMGLFRLYWIPAGLTPGQGAYVRYPHEDLLNIVALEADRAGAFVIGEDLGTVEPGVRQELAGREVMSYRVWWFEDDDPAKWPVKAMGAVTTHDLPTVAGVLSGSDLAEQRRLNLAPNEEAASELHAKLITRTEAEPGTPVEAVIKRVYADLARAPCLLLTASLDDALAVDERPNMPATVDERPNWRLALPAPLDEFEQLELPKAIAASLDERGSARAAAGKP